MEVTRRHDLKVDLTLACEGLPNQLKPRNISIKADADAGELTVAATHLKTRAGIYDFYLRADTRGKLIRNVDAVPQAEAELQDATKELESLKKAVDAASEKEQAASQTRLSNAEEAVAAAKKKLEAAKKENAAKDVSFVTISEPLRVRIVDSPLRLSVSAPQEARPGDSAKLSVRVDRMFGFADSVDLTAEVEGDRPGVQVKKVVLEKDNSEIQLAAAIAKDAPLGKVALTVNAKARFNKHEVESTERVEFDITE